MGGGGRALRASACLQSRRHRRAGRPHRHRRTGSGARRAPPEGAPPERAAGRIPAFQSRQRLRRAVSMVRGAAVVSRRLASGQRQRRLHLQPRGQPRPPRTAGERARLLPRGARFGPEPSRELRDRGGGGAHPRHGGVPGRGRSPPVVLSRSRPAPHRTARPRPRAADERRFAVHPPERRRDLLRSASRLSGRQALLWSVDRLSGRPAGLLRVPDRIPRCPGPILRGARGGFRPRDHIVGCPGRLSGHLGRPGRLAGLPRRAGRPIRWRRGFGPTPHRRAAGREGGGERGPDPDRADRAEAPPRAPRPHPRTFRIRHRERHSRCARRRARTRERRSVEGPDRR